MHGSLIDSHHRSSLNSNVGGASILVCVEDSLIDDEEIRRTKSNIKEEPDEKSVETKSPDDSANFFRWQSGNRRVMLTFATICLFAFMTGVEYAVILPTVFDYVKTMSNVNIYVGLILSAYSVSGSIAGIIMGQVSDFTGKVKILIIIATFFEVVGNVLYFARKNIHVVLLGRLTAGVGMGIVPPILADVAHRTTEKDRTKAVAIILGCRQIGLLIGPCFTLLIRSMDFHIGSIHIHHLNGPGFLMAIIWICLQILTFFCFYDRDSSSTKTHQTLDRNDNQEKKNRISMKTYQNQYCRIEMFVLFFATFITYFNQTALETIVAAFTEKYFRWNSLHTSILFAFAGLEILLVYLILVKVCSSRFQDRSLLCFGFISLGLACVLGTFFTWVSYLYSWSPETTGDVDKRLLVMFIVFVILDLLGLPFLAATSVSLCTKITNGALQGSSQGIQRFVMGIGTIVGPLFASSLLTSLHIMMSTMLILILLILFSLLIVFKRLIPLSNVGSTNERTAETNDRHSSTGDENDELVATATPTGQMKKAYVTLPQNEEEEDDVKIGQENNRFFDKASKFISINKRSSNHSLIGDQITISPSNLNFEQQTLHSIDAVQRTMNPYGFNMIPSNFISTPYYNIFPSNGYQNTFINGFPPFTANNLNFLPSQPVPYSTPNFLPATNGNFYNFSMGYPINNLVYPGNPMMLNPYPAPSNLVSSAPVQHSLSRPIGSSGAFRRENVRRRRVPITSSSTSSDSNFEENRSAQKESSTSL